MDKTLLKHIGETIFAMLGGGAALFHLGLKFLPDAVEDGIVFIAKKYPAVGIFIKNHAPAIIASLQAIEKSEESAVNKIAENQPSQDAPK